ncbi:hypothetical protein [Mesoterricola silvestris]|uniref:Uncharacterized protein n=1 Tax=Mesoterricola silvestris TaxID=2927979 RepID=A0AA48GJA9_9BACT|nr:hypothetical protein [Mesoterricola silvestris]BDU72159.1 hypothetical protein METEAL_13330 [Mesoterricola silvestris]
MKFRDPRPWLARSLATAPMVPLALGLVLSLACGGGGSRPAAGTMTVGNPPPGKPTPPSITGTATAGTPLVGTITLKDSAVPQHVLTAPCDVDGTFRFNTEGLKAPFMLKAEGQAGGVRRELYSAGDSWDLDGKVNITPCTDVIVALAAGMPAAATFEQGTFARLTHSVLEFQMGELQLETAPLLAALGLSPTLDYLHGSIPADHTGPGALLDVLQASGAWGLPVATLRNAVNGTSARFNLATGVVSGQLSGLGVTAAMGAFQSIRAGIKRLEDLSRTGTPPTMAQIRELGFFDPGGFLQDGLSFPEWVDRDLRPRFADGLPFPAMTLVSADARKVIVRFQTLPSAGGHSVRSLGPWVFHRDPTAETWVCVGNQRDLDVQQFEPMVSYTPSDPVQPIRSGLYLHLEDPKGVLGANGYAVLSGPGIASTPYIPPVSGAGAFELGPGQADPFLAVTEDQVLRIPASGSVYALALYSMATGEPVLAATYDLPLVTPPTPIAELNPASFATLGSTAPAGSNSSITRPITIPDDYEVLGLLAFLWDDESHKFSYRVNYSSDDTVSRDSYTIPSDAVGGRTFSHGDVNIYCKRRNRYERKMFFDEF